MTAANNRQRGFALVLVMSLVATAVVLGLGYLYTASMRLACTGNMISASRAKYLAESGLQHALYVAQTDLEAFDGSPSTPLGPYYVDGSPDKYFFYAVQDAVDPRRYTIVATATAGQSTQTASAVILAGGDGLYTVSKGLMVANGTVWLPESLTIRSDFHVNGHLINMATLRENVSATGYVWDPYDRISGTISNYTAAVEVPELNWQDYVQYKLAGAANTAVVKTGNVLTRSDPVNRGGSITPGNTGGVVWLKPRTGSTVTLAKNVSFKGTLVVNGNLLLDGSHIEITAQEGFPAIVVTGRIYVTNRADVKISGVVHAGDGMVPYGRTRSSKTDIKGAFLSRYRSYDLSLAGKHKLTYREDKCQLYDFSGDSAGAAGVAILDTN